MADFGEDLFLEQVPYAGKFVPLITCPQVAHQQACAFANVGPQDVACDLGCGLGGFCLEAAKCGAHAIGLDINFEILRQAEANAEESAVAHMCTFRQCDFTSPDFEVPSEVTVLFMYLLPWALDYLDRELHRFLDRGGRFVTFQFHPANFEASTVYLFGALKLYGTRSKELLDAGEPTEQCNGVGRPQWTVT